MQRKKVQLLQIIAARKRKYWTKS